LAEEWDRQLNINLTDALEENFEKKTSRDRERHL
jgi:hypothetical protein